MCAAGCAEMCNSFDLNAWRRSFTASAAMGAWSWKKNGHHQPCVDVQMATRAGEALWCKHEEGEEAGTGNVDSCKSWPGGMPISSSSLFVAVEKHITTPCIITFTQMWKACQGQVRLSPILTCLTPFTLLSFPDAFARRFTNDAFAMTTHLHYSVQTSMVS